MLFQSITAMEENGQLECERRSLFDSISLNLLTKLENSKEISTMEFRSEKGASIDQLHSWEKANEPYLLPDDLTSFYSIFNGVSLHWDVSIGQKNVSVGEIKLNDLKELRQVESSHQASFILNSQTDVGDIILVYDYSSSNVNDDKHPHQGLKSEIWFRDSAFNWYYMCSTFKQLFRLMITHLGKLKYAVKCFSACCPAFI
jgi:hypothetical protein